MGINIDRFVGDVDSNFICSICNDVLEDPLQAPVCEHAFCKICISQWLNRSHSCPLDREQLTIGDLRPVSRILRCFLSRLTLACNNQIHGCPAIVAPEELETHLLECSFNPKRLVSCNSGCGITVYLDELAKHNCAQSLRLEMKETSEILFGLVDVETENKSKMSEIESKLAVFHLETEDKMSKILGINANLVQKLERVEKANEDQMSKILGINANLVQKSERVEKANENKMLITQSKLELLEAEMAKIRISMLNSLHVESATLKQRLVEAERKAADELKHLREEISCVFQENRRVEAERRATEELKRLCEEMSRVTQENVKIREECSKLKRSVAIGESNVNNFAQIHMQSFFQPMTYARLIIFVLSGLWFGYIVGKVY